MSMTVAPKGISPIVKRFCRTIASGQKPVFLEVQADDSAAAPLDCFATVHKRMRRMGGSIQYGWRIWEWPTIMIEAEFHAVWVSPTGTLTEISPNPGGFSKILFLPDDKLQYEGRQINNIRHAISRSPLVKEYIDLSDRLFEEQNKGDLAYMHGLVPLSREAQLLMERLSQIQAILYKRSSKNPLSL